MHFILFLVSGWCKPKVDSLSLIIAVKIYRYLVNEYCLLLILSLFFRSCGQLLWLIYNGGMLVYRNDTLAAAC